MKSTKFVNKRTQTAIRGTDLTITISDKSSRRKVSKFLSIIGAGEIDKKLIFYMNFTTGCRLVKSDEAYRHFLDEVIKFFEENLTFSNEKLYEKKDLPSKIRTHSYMSNLRPRKILGAFKLKSRNGIVFVVEFQTNAVELFMAKVAHIRWPKLVLDFYLSRISWVTS